VTLVNAVVAVVAVVNCRIILIDKKEETVMKWVSVNFKIFVILKATNLKHFLSYCFPFGV